VYDLLALPLVNLSRRLGLEGASQARVPSPAAGQPGPGAGGDCGLRRGPGRNMRAMTAALPRLHQHSPLASCADRSGATLPAALGTGVTPLGDAWAVSGGPGPAPSAGKPGRGSGPRGASASAMAAARHLHRETLPFKTRS